MYKESDINYFIINKMTQEKYTVNIATMLTSRQYNNLKYFPDLIVPLAKKIQLEAGKNFGIKNAKSIYGVYGRRNANNGRGKFRGNYRRRIKSRI